MNETLTLRDLVLKAKDSGLSYRQMEEKVAASEKREPRGLRLNRTTASKIARGTHGGDAEDGTIRAIALVAGVPDHVAFTAAGRRTNGPAFAEQLPAGIDDLDPRERRVALDLLRVLVAQRQELNRHAEDTARQPDDRPAEESRAQGTEDQKTYAERLGLNNELLKQYGIKPGRDDGSFEQMWAAGYRAGHGPLIRAALARAMNVSNTKSGKLRGASFWREVAHALDGGDGSSLKPAPPLPAANQTEKTVRDVGRRLAGVRQQGLTVWMGTGIDLAEKYRSLPVSLQGDVADAWRTATRGDAPDPDQISRIKDALDIVLFSTPHSEDTHGLGVNVEVDTDDWATMLDYRDRGIAHIRALAVPPSERASSDDWAEYQRTQLPITDDQATAGGARPLTGTGQKQSSDIDSPEGELLVQYLDAWANLGAACAHVLNKIAHLRKPSLPYETGAVVENIQGILDAVDILFTHHITIIHDGEGRSPRMDTVDRAFRRAERAAGALPLADQLRANANRPITLDDKDINDIVATSPVVDAIAAANNAYVAAFPNSPSPDELESRMKRDEEDLVEVVEALLAAHAKASKYEESTTRANEAFLYAASLVGADSGRPTGPVAVRSARGAGSGGSKVLRAAPQQSDDEWVPEAARTRPKGFRPQDPDAYDNTIGEESQVADASEFD
ncbi:hypothetical protein [Gordonia sp. MMO-8]|uniref:hypothetical protein n=1 Tax=Gordonia sp. MMO-8 TaxID=3127886 RepID=UPI00301668C5